MPTARVVGTRELSARCTASINSMNDQKPKTTAGVRGGHRTAHTGSSDHTGLFFSKSYHGNIFGHVMSLRGDYECSKLAFYM